MHARASSRISYMAEDHFTTNMWKPNEVDWHFLIRLNNQSQIRDMVKRYAEIYDHPGLYPPIPFEWLHMTILRIGNVANITDQEMNDVIERLFPALEMIHMPELLLGPWWLWTGSVVLHVTPEEPITQLVNAVMKVMNTVVGEKAPKPDRFIPHVTLAYARNYQQEREVHKQLCAQWIDPIPLHVTTLSLVKEKQTSPLYRWDAVTEIPIGK
jgi:2'-5' RNA ligase